MASRAAMACAACVAHARPLRPHGPCCRTASLQARGPPVSASASGGDAERARGQAPSAARAAARSARVSAPPRAARLLTRVRRRAPDDRRLGRAAGAAGRGHGRAAAVQLLRHVCDRRALQLPDPREPAAESPGRVTPAGHERAVGRRSPGHQRRPPVTMLWGFARRWCMAQ